MVFIAIILSCLIGISLGLGLFSVYRYFKQKERKSIWLAAGCLVFSAIIYFLTTTLLPATL